MRTTFKATVHTLLPTPSAVIWTLIFPIVLATVFNFMFEPMRSTGSVEAVKVAVVADDAWEDSPFSQVVDTLSEADEPLLAVHPVAGEDEARVLLAEGSVAGAYVVDAAGESTATPSASAAGAPRIILAPAGSGTSSDASYDVNRAILESVATSYLQRVALIEDLSAHDPAALSDPIALEDALGLGVSVREVSFTHAQPDSMVRFYYALLGMASIFAAQLAGESVWRLQPTSSAAGARRAVSGTSRMRLLIPTIGACWAVSTTFLVIAFGYICLTAHIDFSGREGLCLVGIAASSLLSCGIGALVGALPGRMGSDSRRGHPHGAYLPAVAFCRPLRRAHDGARRYRRTCLPRCDVAQPGLPDPRPVLHRLLLRHTRPVLPSPSGVRRHRSRAACRIGRLHEEVRA